MALKDGMTLLDLYHERISYFEKYADITIDEEGKELGAVVDELREILEETRLCAGKCAGGRVTISHENGGSRFCRTGFITGYSEKKSVAKQLKIQYNRIVTIFIEC